MENIGNSVLDELQKFYQEFDEEKGFIGFTELGEKIPFFKVKKTNFPVCIFQYAIHAREYITTYLAMEQIKDYLINGKKGLIYFIPAVNIDGIRIALSTNELYKANAKGVDLNVNFDAKWGSGEKNTNVVGSENFIGEFPFSASETVALRDFTLAVSPDMTVSYHAKGEEIYYQFYQSEKQMEFDFVLAKAVADATGYEIKPTPNSAGGYKDWCIEKLKIPALTIEVGKDNLTHPIKKEFLPDIYQKNKRVIYAITESDIWTNNL